MTESRTYEIPSRVGRKMLYPVRITLPLEQQMADRIDAALANDEARVDLIRVAIEKELVSRETSKKGKRRG